MFFPQLIYGDQEPLRPLNVIEDDYQFLGVHMRLSTRCKIWFTLGLFANYFSLKSLSLSLKSHMNVLCALKLTELWNTSLLFDLNYEFINGSLAFSAIICLENRWKGLHMFAKSSSLDLEPSTMIQADFVSFSPLLMMEFRSIRRCFAFPGQIHRWILNGI